MAQISRLLGNKYGAIKVIQCCFNCPKLLCDWTVAEFKMYMNFMDIPPEQYTATCPACLYNGIVYFVEWADESMEVEDGQLCVRYNGWDNPAFQSKVARLFKPSGPRFRNFMSIAQHGFRSPHVTLDEWNNYRTADIKQEDLRAKYDRLMKKYGDRYSKLFTPAGKVAKKKRAKVFIGQIASILSAKVAKELWA